MKSLAENIGEMWRDYAERYRTAGLGGKILLGAGTFAAVAGAGLGLYFIADAAMQLDYLAQHNFAQQMSGYLAQIEILANDMGTSDICSQQNSVYQLQMAHLDGSGGKYAFDLVADWVLRNMHAQQMCTEMQEDPSLLPGLQNIVKDHLKQGYLILSAARQSYAQMLTGARLQILGGLGFCMLSAGSGILVGLKPDHK